MRKSGILIKIYICLLSFSLFALMGCSGESTNLTDNQSAEKQTMEMQMPEETLQAEEPSIDSISQPTDTLADEMEEEEETETEAAPVMIEVDWSEYFDEYNGAAVIYDTAEDCYQIYNQELANTRRSPCSTFKIISSLIALEDGVIETDNSTRAWSGEIFWNEDWNRDIDFSDAFHASCVWYFREVIDEIGRDTIQEELIKLQYGNCDISDWEGRLNTNNSNPVLTGFWIESSLLISPKEQTEVMERIFGNQTDYSEQTLNQLKQVMLLAEQSETDISIYGKTGMGKAHGIVVDAWFTGFADKDDKRIYFCVYLGETENSDVSSARAREIAIKIVSDYLG